MHVPVMAAESMELLAIRPDGIYLDATAGLGGHTAMIAERLTTGIVIANGASDVVAREIVGYETAAVSRTYSHIDMATLRGAIDKLPDLMSGD